MEKLKRDAAMTFQLKESLNGYEIVTVFGTIHGIRERFLQSSREMANADYKMQVFISLMQNVAQVAQKITWFLAFLFAGGLVKLLSGYYTTYTGAIYYDNIELREMNLHKLRHIVAFIQQNTIIFNESIRFNICMGESFSDEELHNALLVSGVDRFLKDIPQGWGMR